jgi:serine protease Do
MLLGAGQGHQRSPRALAPRLLAVLALGLSPAHALAQSTGPAAPANLDVLVQRVRPAVVTILSQNTELRRASRDAKPVSRTHTRVGSGVAIETSQILTTASVVLRAERVRVRTANGLEADAQIVGVDPVFNVALLRVNDLRLPALPFSSARGGRIGDWVLTVGSSYRFQLTESVGTISAIYPEPRLSLLQLTNTVSPGNSGAAAVNARGELLGIVQGELGSPEIHPSLDNERRPSGISFVLPAETVYRVVQALQRDGRLRHGYLGVTTSGASVPSESERGLDIPIGAIVENVVPGGPAARVGLQRGDLIVGFEGERVEYPGQLARWVAATPPGTSVGLVWVRRDLQKVGSAVLGDSPDPMPAWAMSSPISSTPPADAGDRRDSAQGPGKIADIERQIRELNRQLEQLKGQSARSRRE